MYVRSYDKDVKIVMDESGVIRYQILRMSNDTWKIYDQNGEKKISGETFTDHKKAFKAIQITARAHGFE